MHRYTGALRGSPCDSGGPQRAVSSAVEHYLDMVGVTGSNPVPPTTEHPAGAIRPFCFPVEHRAGRSLTCVLQRTNLASTAMCRRNGEDFGPRGRSRVRHGDYQPPLIIRARPPQEFPNEARSAFFVAWRSSAARRDQVFQEWYP